MKIKYIFSLAALTLMLAACSSDEFTQQPTVTNQGIPFKAVISTGAAGTRGLTEGDKTISAAWAKDEKVALVYGSSYDIMTIESVEDNGLATITGTVSGSPRDGDNVVVVYCGTGTSLSTLEQKIKGAEDDDAVIAAVTGSDLFKSQAGTFAGINAALDLRISSEAKFAVTGSSATLSGTTKLTERFAIWKLDLTDGTNAIKADKFTVGYGSSSITVTPSEATSELYVAMAPATTSAFKFEATAASTTYYYNQPSASLAAGTYYQSPMALKDMLHTPLTFEAIEDGTINVTIPDELELAKPVTYTKNGVDYSGGTTSFDIAVAVGDIVTFHSTNAALGKLVNSSYTHTSIKPTNRCYIYGNIMSMIDDAGDFATDKAITGDYALYALFSGADKLENHPAKEILLPATTLTNYCYTELFSGCKALTKAPELPATELKTRCYEQMFWECTSLTEAPVMSATTVASYCCQDMFNGCTSLVKAPDLLATTLAEKCYNGMFKGCSSLSYVQCLATNNIGNDYMNGWLDGVSATGTLEVASTAVWAVAGNNGIPSGWTVIGRVDVDTPTGGSQENYDIENTDNW